jgi:hypothetical protein
MSERSEVAVSVTQLPSGHAVLTVRGTLDGITYREVRDRIVKAALDEPVAVVVDVTGLHAPQSSAWTVLTSARWQVSTWPDVPVLAVCAHAEGRAILRRAAIPRYVPVHHDVPSAIMSLTSLSSLRRRARATLAADASAVVFARKLVTDWLTQWGRPAMVGAAATVATTLVENVLQHTDSAPTLILEVASNSITVAVSDDDPRPAVRIDTRAAGAHTVSGLAIVAALTRRWGCCTTPDGKTVWAVIGGEDRL